MRPMSRFGIHSKHLFSVEISWMEAAIFLMGKKGVELDT